MNDDKSQLVANPPIHDLNMEELGRCLVNALLGSQLLGHASVHGTMRDYTKPHELTPEGRFVRDVFVRRTEDVAAEWFGDDLTATAYATFQIGATLAAGIDRYAEKYARPEDLTKETTE